MAEEKKEEGGVPETVTFIVGLLLALGVIWWARGGPNAPIDEGLLVNPPPPVGDGATYDPELGTSTDLRY